MADISRWHEPSRLLNANSGESGASLVGIPTREGRTSTNLEGRTTDIENDLDSLDTRVGDIEVGEPGGGHGVNALDYATNVSNAVNGTENIAPAIQAAHDAIPQTGGNRKIFLPPGGLYLWDSAVQISKDSVELDLGGAHGKSVNTGGHVKIGAGLLNQTMIKLTRSQWHIDNAFNATRGCAIRNLGVMDSGRTTSIENVIHIERADEVTIENIHAQHVRGRVLYTQRCVKSSVHNLAAIYSGDVGKSVVHLSSIDGTNYTQGCNISDVKVEVAYGSNDYAGGATDAYLLIGSDVYNTKLSHLGFEAAVGILESSMKYINCLGKDNQFDTVHCNKYDSTTAVSFPAIDLGGNWNSIANLHSAGFMPWHVVRLTGEGQRVATQLTRFSAAGTKYGVYMESGRLHSATDITVFGGLALAILAAVSDSRGMGLTAYRADGGAVAFTNSGTNSTTSNVILRNTA